MKYFSKTFPKEIAQFITANNHGRTLAEITALVNATFGTEYGQRQLSSYRKNHHLQSGFTGRFEKGHVPSNKGKKGVWHKGSEKTWFQKGHTPHNHAEIGTEAWTTDGYLKVKVAEPNKWRFKHIMEWEKHHGEVPEGMLISFKNGDYSDCSIENLMMISRGENAILNHQNLRSSSPELTETGVLLAKLQHAVAAKKRGETKEETQC